MRRSLRNSDEESRKNAVSINKQSLAKERLLPNACHPTLTSDTRTNSHLRSTGITQVVVLLVNQAFMIVLARILNPDDFGRYAICIAFGNILVYLSTLGLDSALVQRQSDIDKALRTGSSLRLLLSIVVVLLFLPSAPWVAQLAGFPNLRLPLQVSAIAVVVTALSFESAVRISRDLRFRVLNYARVLNAVVWSISSLLLAYSGFGFWSLVYGYILGNVAMTLALCASEPLRIGFEIDWGLSRGLLRFGVYSMGTSLVAFLVWNLDKIIIGRYSEDASLLGIYWLAATVGTLIPSIFTGAISTVMFPTMSRIQHDVGALKRRYLSTLRHLSYVSIPLGVGLAATSETFVVVVLGEEWAAGAIPLALFSIVGVLSALTSPASSVLLAVGRPEKMFRQTLGTAILFFSLIIPAFTYGGIIGVAILFMLTGAISLVWILVIVAGILGFSLADELASLINPIGSSIAILASSFMIRHYFGISALSLVAQIISGLLLYSVLVITLTKGRALSRLFEMLRFKR